MSRTKKIYDKALILGASSDMARAFARKLAEAGTDLVLAAIDVKEVEADAADLRIRHGIDVKLVPLNILDRKSRDSLMKGLGDGVGLVALFVGILGDQASAEKDQDAAKLILDVNFTGSALMLNEAAVYLQRQTMERRSIVALSSVAGDRGRQSNYLYGSAKAGLTAYLSGLRNRLAKEGIQVLTVKPGFVRTSMTAGMKLPAPITASAEQVVNDIYRALASRKDVLYTLWMWRFIMLIIRHIPEAIFKKLKL